MEMSGSYRIAASRQQVWEALNDPEVLKACIPGCEALTRNAEGQLEAAVVSKIGPVKARFTGKVTLSNLDPPKSYTITGEGSGGVAGFAKGGADVRLEEEAPELTRLDYEARAQVGGKLAQLGARLIDGVAKKMADDFFAAFASKVGPVAEAEPASVEAPSLAPQAEEWTAEAPAREAAPAPAPAHSVPSVGSTAAGPGSAAPAGAAAGFSGLTVAVVAAVVIAVVVLVVALS